SAQGELVQENKPTLNNEGALAALNFWSTLLKDGSAINSLPERGYEQDAFISGKVAMQLTGPWTLSFLDSTDVDYDVMPIPVDKKPATALGGSNLFVMKTNPKREQAALKFLEYVLSEEFQTELAIATGGLPINVKSRESKTYQEYVAKQPALKVFLQQMAVSRSRPIVPQYYRLSQSIGEAIEATLLGKSPEKSLQTAQQRAELAWNL
ncbi:MAG TPA: extracellular solute-binding protein, partial [Phormidium sp.]